MYVTITNNNDRNHALLSNAKIREAIDQLILEYQSEANNFTVDTFSPQINESDNLIKEVINLTINEVRNNLIDKVANLTIINFGNNLIKKVANFAIDYVRNNSNGATASDVQVQFVGNSAGISHQNLLGG